MRESVRKDTFKHCRFRCIQFLNVYYDLPCGERDDANLFLLRSSFNFTHAKRMKTREKKSFEMVRTKDRDRWSAFLIIYYSSRMVIFLWLIILCVVQAKTMMLVRYFVCVCVFLRAENGIWNKAMHNQNFRWVLMFLHASNSMWGISYEGEREREQSQLQLISAKLNSLI